ncbi:MAG: ABC transporter permease subunit, partial [Desulfobacterales bacterium]
MKPEKNQRTVARPQSYYFWVGVFCVFALVVMGLFYYATQKIEYVWRWNRVPIYFAYQDTIDVTSEIDGDVASITKEGDTATITVKGLDESVSFEIPAAAVSVEEGEIISIGDTLGSYTQWKPGLLIMGLWLTLKISVLATIFGVIIGIIGGLTRISGNPALKWTTIVYVEVIRGSPLLVQILIWYFILGTVFNELLAAY